VASSVFAILDNLMLICHELVVARNIAHCCAAFNCTL